MSKFNQIKAQANFYAKAREEQFRNKAKEN